MVYLTTHGIGSNANGNGVPSLEPSIERAFHFHALVQIHQAATAFVQVFDFVFVIAFLQCIQVPIFFDVSEDGVHHDAGFVIGDVRNHGVLRDEFIRYVQHIIVVVLNVGFNVECAKMRLSHGVGWPGMRLIWEKCRFDICWLVLVLVLWLVL